MEHTQAELLLVEHVTGALPEATRVALEAHLAGCEACRALEASLSLGAKLAAALPVEPPPKLDMAALRAAVRARAAAADPEGPSSSAAAMAAPEPSGGGASKTHGPSIDANVRPGFGEVFRRWVTGPQVAMATLTSLVLAIGLTYIPLANRSMPADGDTVAAPEAEPAAGAPHVVVSEDGIDADRGSIAPAAPAPAQQAQAAPQARLEEVELAAAEEPQREIASPHGIIGDEPPAEATNALPAPAVAAIVPPAPVPATPRADALDAESNDRRAAQSTGSGRAGLGGAPMDALASSGGESAPSARYAAPPPSPPQAQAATAQTATTQAQTRAQDGAGATLAQARSLRSSGQCGAATNAYQRFLNEAGTGHPQRGQAMLELADCLQRTGRTGVARQTLEQAQGVPSVSAQARRELERSAAQERQAPSRSARPSAAPRQSEDAVMDAYRSE